MGRHGRYITYTATSQPEAQPELQAKMQAIKADNSTAMAAQIAVAQAHLQISAEEVATSNHNMNTKLPPLSYY